MRMITLASPDIQGIAYEIQTQTLYVMFHQGSVYQYCPVTSKSYAELMNADNLTEYLTDQIQKKTTAKKLVKLLPVASASIQRLGYDADTYHLFIQFQNGSVYDYQDISPTLYAELMNASSMGAFVNRRIRNHFPYEKIWFERMPAHAFH